MAALSLRQSGSLLASWAPAFLSATPFALPSLSRWSLPSLADLFPSIVLAVPKSKVSHSRKSMRSANKGLKDKMNLVNCPGCGSAKLAHHLCANCFSQVSRKHKQQARQQAGSEI